MRKIPSLYQHKFQGVKCCRMCESRRRSNRVTMSFQARCIYVFHFVDIGYFRRHLRINHIQTHSLSQLYGMWLKKRRASNENLLIVHCFPVTGARLEKRVNYDRCFWVTVVIGIKCFASLASLKRFAFLWVFQNQSFNCVASDYHTSWL